MRNLQGTIHVEDYVDDLDKKIWIPTKQEAKYQVSEGWLFVGGDLGRSHGFHPQVDSNTARENLEKVFGPPNSLPRFTRGNRGKPASEKPSWEFLLAVENTGCWFSVYEIGGQVFIGYRFLTEKMFADVVRPQYFEVSEEACEGFCDMVNRIVTGESLPIVDKKKSAASQNRLTRELK